MYCWQCGARVRARAKACRRCGAALEAPTRLRASRVLLRRRLLPIGLLVLSLLGLIGLGVAHLRPPDLRTIVVPDVVGLDPGAAKARLQRAGLTPHVRARASSDSALWHLVLRQTPLAGLQASRGEQVALLVYVPEGEAPDAPDSVASAPGHGIAYLPYVDDESPEPKPASSQSVRPSAPDGPAPAPAYGVPNVVGWEVGHATRQLRAVGLSLEVQRRSLSDWAPAGSVLRQHPMGGSDAPADDIVRVVVSAGRGAVMPAVVGLREREALSRLSAAGLRARVERRAGQAETGRVVAADAHAGRGLPPGSTVRLVVSTGPASPRSRRRARPAPASSSGALYVTAEPGNCPVWVYVDGGPALGTCPRRLTLTPGRHRVTFWDTKDLRAVEATVEISPGKTTTLHRRLH